MAEEIFTASTENLRDLKKQRKRICALVNRAIREKQDPDLISLTKMYALLYSAYVETSFLKLIHTPKAFTESEIIQIINLIQLIWEKLQIKNKHYTDFYKNILLTPAK